MTGKRK